MVMPDLGAASEPLPQRRQLVQLRPGKGSGAFAGPDSISRPSIATSKAPSTTMERYRAAGDPLPRVRWRAASLPNDSQVVRPFRPSGPVPEGSRSCRSPTARITISASRCYSRSSSRPSSLCFFPTWAARFEFTEIDWLDKELFTAPPQGEKRQLDLVARLELRPDAPPPRDGATDLVALVHVEVESRDSVAAFRPRMFDYYVQLRRDTGLPVLPIALLLRVGLDGSGWDAYEEHFWEQQIIRFEYAYVGLPALPAEPYATGENLLGVASVP